MTISKAKKPQITWVTMVSIDEIQPRKGKFATYCLLYTRVGNFCCSEKLATQICLYEPYEIRGQVKMVPGGTYLWATSLELFDARSYRKGFA